MATPGLQFVRREDGLTYSFHREQTGWAGRPSYKRDDADLWIRWDETAGWRVLDRDGAASGWPVSRPVEFAPLFAGRKFTPRRWAPLEN
jgi:hypothetical protein